MTSPVKDPRPSITCPECERTSWHPKDVEFGYCGYCSWWTSDPVLSRCPPAGWEPAAPLGEHTAPAVPKVPGRWRRRFSR